MRLIISSIVTVRVDKSEITSDLRTTYEFPDDVVIDYKNMLSDHQQHHAKTLMESTPPTINPQFLFPVSVTFLFLLLSIR